MSRNFTPGTGDIEVTYDMWIQEYETQTWQQSQKEFKRWIDEVKADAWDEGYRDGHSDGLSDGHPLFNDREPEENPYREANDD